LSTVAERSEEASVRRHPRGSWILLAVLALAVALPPGCDGRSDVQTPPPSAEADVVITIPDGFSFTPNPASVQVGQTVSWHNSDAITHTATDDGGGFNTGDIASGTTSAPMTMNFVGSFFYRCSYDPNMTATLNVTD